jgi:hypothetical protein
MPNSSGLKSSIDSRPYCILITKPVIPKGFRLALPFFERVTFQTSGIDGKGMKTVPGEICIGRCGYATIGVSMSQHILELCPQRVPSTVSLAKENAMLMAAFSKFLSSMPPLKVKHHKLCSGAAADTYMNKVLPVLEQEAHNKSLKGTFICLLDDIHEALEADMICDYHFMSMVQFQWYFNRCIYCKPVADTDHMNVFKIV